VLVCVRVLAGTVAGRGGRVACDVCGASSNRPAVDSAESLTNVVARTAAHLTKLLPRFSHDVSIGFAFD